jgi:hypothetical protein
MSDQPSDGRLRRGLRWVGMAALAAAQLAFLAARGPLRLEAPRTVYSNGHPAQRAAEPYLLFLREVRGIVPAGATVRIRAARNAENSVPAFYMAIGLLPEQRVVSSLPELRAPGEADFVACYGGECAETGYREARRLAGGTLCERIH